MIYTLIKEIMPMFDKGLVTFIGVIVMKIVKMVDPIQLLQIIKMSCCSEELQEIFREACL